MINEVLSLRHRMQEELDAKYAEKLKKEKEERKDTIRKITSAKSRSSERKPNSAGNRYSMMP
jgi:hypothetical protein